jgi:hypothetical protein
VSLLHLRNQIPFVVKQPVQLFEFFFKLICQLQLDFKPFGHLLQSQDILLFQTDLSLQLNPHLDDLLLELLLPLKQADSECPQVLSAHQKHFQPATPLHLRINDLFLESQDLLLVLFANLLNQVIFRADFPLHPFAINDHLVIVFLQLRYMFI